MIKKFNQLHIKEAVETKKENEFSFSEKTKDVSIFNFHKSSYASGLNIVNKEDYDVHVTEMSVEWEIDIQLKSWGIWHFQPMVTRVYGSIDVQVLDDNSDVTNEKTIDFTSDEFKFETNLDVSESTGDTLLSGIIIDFERKIITADIQVCVQAQKAE